MLQVSLQLAHLFLFLGQRPLQLVDFAYVFRLGGCLLEVSREFVGVLHQELNLGLVVLLRF